MGRSIFIKTGVAVAVASFVCLLAATGFAQPQGKGPGGPGIGNFIGNFDKNGDGKVSQDEFNGPDDRFMMIDKNQDGFITEDEVPKGPPGGDKGPGGPEGKGPRGLPVI